jgi:membrane-associated protein
VGHEWLIHLIQQYGYFALFFALWLGAFGAPVPDEVVVMTAGAATTWGLLRALPAFLMTLLGVESGLTVGYTIGYLLGPPILNRLAKIRRLRPQIARAHRVLSRFGAIALVLSYWIPVVRHLVPYLAGADCMPFRRYALAAYTTGLVWTLFYFAIGLLVGRTVAVEEIWRLIIKDGGLILVLLAVLLLLWWGRRRWLRSAP